jgi:hypothetical protein
VAHCEPKGDHNTTKRRHQECQSRHRRDQVRTAKPEEPEHRTPRGNSIPANRAKCLFSIAPTNAIIGVSGRVRREPPSSQTTSNQFPNRESRHLRIGTQARPDDANTADTTFTSYLPSAAANTYTRNALLNTNETNDT